MFLLDHWAIKILTTELKAWNLAIVLCTRETELVYIRKVTKLTTFTLEFYPISRLIQEPKYLPEWYLKVH